MLRKTDEIMGDLELAKFLDSRGATQNFEHHVNSVWWRAPGGRVVAVVFYDNGKSRKTSTHIDVKED